MPGPQVSLAGFQGSAHCRDQHRRSFSQEPLPVSCEDLSQEHWLNSRPHTKPGGRACGQHELHCLCKQPETAGRYHPGMTEPFPSPSLSKDGGLPCRAGTKSGLGRCGLPKGPILSRCPTRAAHRTSPTAGLLWWHFGECLSDLKFTFSFPFPFFPSSFFFLFFHFLVFRGFFWDKISCSPGWPWNCCVLKDNLKLLILLSLPQKC